MPLLTPPQNSRGNHRQATVRGRDGRSSAPNDTPSCGTSNTDKVLIDVQNRLNSQGVILDQLGRSVIGQEERMTSHFRGELRAVLGEFTSKQGQPQEANEVPSPRRKTVQQRQGYSTDTEVMSHAQQRASHVAPYGSQRYDDLDPRHISTGDAHAPAKRQNTIQKKPPPYYYEERACSPSNANQNTSHNREQQSDGFDHLSSHRLDHAGSPHETQDGDGMLKGQLPVVLAHILNQLETLTPISETHPISRHDGDNQNVQTQLYHTEIKTLFEVSSDNIQGRIGKIEDSILTQSNKQINDFSSRLIKRLEQTTNSVQNEIVELKENIVQTVSAQTRNQLSEVNDKLKSGSAEIKDMKNEMKTTMKNFQLYSNMSVFILPVMLVLMPFSTYLTSKGSECDYQLSQESTVIFENMLNAKTESITNTLNIDSAELKDSFTKLSREVSMIDTKGFEHLIQTIVRENINDVVTMQQALISKFRTDVTNQVTEIADKITKLNTILDGQMNSFHVNVEKQIGSVLNHTNTIQKNVKKLMIQQNYSVKNDTGKELKLLGDGIVTALLSMNTTLNETNYTIEQKYVKMKKDIVKDLGRRLEEKLNLSNDEFLSGIVGKLGEEFIRKSSENVKNISETLELFSKRANKIFMIPVKKDGNITFVQAKQDPKADRITVDQHKDLEDFQEDIFNEIKQMTSTVREEITNAKNQVIQFQVTSTNTLQSDMDKYNQFLFRDISEVIEKEGQLSRELNQGDVDPRNSYEFFFPVKLFDQRIGSGVWVVSCPWFVKQFDTSIRGNVKFNADGSMSVFMIFGRYPKRVGLPPKPPSRYSYRVSLVTEGVVDHETLLGESTDGIIDEALPKAGSDASALHAWKISRDEILSLVKGDKLIVKYIINVLPGAPKFY